MKRIITRSKIGNEKKNILMPGLLSFISEGSRKQLRSH